MSMIQRTLVAMIFQDRVYLMWSKIDLKDKQQEEQGE